MSYLLDVSGFCVTLPEDGLRCKVGSMAFMRGGGISFHSLPGAATGFGRHAAGKLACGVS